jgi:NTP pyrophosphatase (non-canonical NTP hydrolase)
MTLEDIIEAAKDGQEREGALYKGGIRSQYEAARQKAQDEGAEVFTVYYLVETTTDVTRPSFQICNEFFVTEHGGPIEKKAAREIIKAHQQKQMNEQIIAAANLITEVSHAASLKAGWWHDLKTGELIEPNIGEKLMLVVSEVSEAMEGARKNLMDDKLPHRKMIEVELADAVIRIGDLCGRLNLDLGGAIAEKLEYNAHRPDHKKENRLGENGKKF